jgi:hypothetical protein
MAKKQVLSTQDTDPTPPPITSWTSRRSRSWPAQPQALEASVSSLLGEPAASALLGKPAASSLLGEPPVSATLPEADLVLRLLHPSTSCWLLWRGQALRLPPQQLDLLVLLVLGAARFQPFTDQQTASAETLANSDWQPQSLQMALLGTSSRSSSLRTALCKLRMILPVTERRYRLNCVVKCDVFEVEQALATGDLATIIQLYQQPLLPQSHSPAINEYRQRLEAQMQGLILGSQQGELVLQWLDRGGDDPEVLAHAQDLLPAQDPRHKDLQQRLQAILQAILQADEVV